MAITAIRTVIIYIFIIAAMRIMGKRQLGELQPIELVVTLLISDLAAVPMQESGMPLINGLIPILILVALELLFSGLMLKSSLFSRLISGTPIVVVNKGKLDQKALKKLRLTSEDLMESLRMQNVFDLQEIEYAIAETNGKISVFKNPEFRAPTCSDLSVVQPDNVMPVVAVSDGHISDWALSICEVDHSWVERTLADNACTLEDVFLLTVDRSRNYFIVRKEK